MLTLLSVALLLVLGFFALLVLALFLLPLISLYRDFEFYVLKAHADRHFNARLAFQEFQSLRPR